MLQFKIQIKCKMMQTKFCIIQTLIFISYKKFNDYQWRDQNLFKLCLYEYNMLIKRIVKKMMSSKNILYVVNHFILFQHIQC